MIVNYKLLKISKRVAIILLVTVFSIAGFTSCSKAVTEPSVSQTEVDSGNNEPTPSDPTVSPDYPNSPKNSAWDESSYRSIYVPFAGVYSNDAQGKPVWNYATVSYMDRETLTQLWKDQMDAKGRGKDKDFFIRNHNNAFADFKTGNNYYFFDADYNIRHKKWPDVVIKQFVGGVMTMYYHDDPGSISKGTVVVGGLYRTALADNSRVVDNDKGVSYFLNGRKVGDLEVLIMNIGATTGGFTYFGLDITYYNGNSGAYSGLKTVAEEWYKVDRKPETLVEVLTYDALRTKYKADWHPDGSYFYFSEGQAEIKR